MDFKNWFDALEICQQEGSLLLILDSEEVNQVGKFIQKHNVPFASFLLVSMIVTQRGTGSLYSVRTFVLIMTYYLHFIDMSLIILLVTDNPLESTGFSQWREGEPNGNTNENCGYFMYNSSTLYGLSDHLCNYENSSSVRKKLNI